MSGQESTDRVTPTQPVPGSDGRLYGLVGGSQPIGVEHTDHRSASDHAGEENHTGTGRTDHDAGFTGQIDASMPGQPGPGRWVEPTYWLGHAIQRPSEAAPGEGRDRARPGRRYGCHHPARTCDPGRTGKHSPGRWRRPDQGHERRQRQRQLGDPHDHEACSPPM